MLDFAPSPTTSRFAFGKHDAVRLDGITYRLGDATENGYILARADGQGVAESFSHSQMARLVDLGRVEHERNAFLPESAKKRLKFPGDLLSTLSDKQHRSAKPREAVVLAFRELEVGGRSSAPTPPSAQRCRRSRFAPGST